MPGVTYDTGALIAAERDDKLMWKLHHAYLAQKIVPVVPAVVLAQAWRGDRRQVLLVRLLNRCKIEPLNEEDAKTIGGLLRQARSDDIVDANVVVTATRTGGGVVTSDAADIRTLARAAGAALHIVAV